MKKDKIDFIKRFIKHGDKIVPVDTKVAKEFS